MRAATARDLRAHHQQLPPLAAARAASAPRRFVDPGEEALRQTGSYADTARCTRDVTRWVARELERQGRTHAGFILASRKEVARAIGCCVKSVNNARDEATAAGFLYTKRTRRTDRRQGSRGDGPLAWYAGPMLLTAARMAAARRPAGSPLSRGVKSSPRSLPRGVTATSGCSSSSSETSKRRRGEKVEPVAALRRPGDQSPPPTPTAAVGVPVAPGRRRSDPRADALQVAVDAFAGRLPDVDRRTLTKAAGLCPGELLPYFAQLGAFVARHWEPDPERRTETTWVKLPGTVFRARLANEIARQLGAAAVPAEWRGLLKSPARRDELRRGSNAPDPSDASRPPADRATMRSAPHRVAVSLSLRVE